jgi:hypothetical protein
MGTSQAFAAQSGQCQPVPWWSARNATSLPWVRQLLSSLPWISVSKTVVCTRWKWRTERLSFEGEREIARTWRRRWCWTSAESPSWSCNLGCAESLDGIWMECADVTSTWPWSARGCCLRSSRYHSQYPSASKMDHSPICNDDSTARWGRPARVPTTRNTVHTFSHWWIQGRLVGELMAYPSSQRSPIDGAPPRAGWFVSWRIPMNKWMMTIGELPPF